jgi:hypothetical protein
MHYTKTVDFNGNVSAAFLVVTAALTVGGFRLIAQDGRSLEFTRARCGSSRDTPLAGARQIKLTGGSRQLSLEAELGGVSRSIRWIAPLVAGLAAAGLIAFTSLTHRGGQMSDEKIFAPIAIGLAGVIPLLIAASGKRTKRALDTLVENAAMAARVTD